MIKAIAPTPTHFHGNVTAEPPVFLDTAFSFAPLVFSLFFNLVLWTALRWDSRFADLTKAPHSGQVTLLSFSASYDSPDYFYCQSR